MFCKLIIFTFFLWIQPLNAMEMSKMNLLFNSTSIPDKSPIQAAIVYKKLNDERILKLVIKNRSKKNIHFFTDTNISHHTRLVLIKENKKISFANLLSRMSMHIESTYRKLEEIGSLKPDEHYEMSKIIITKNNDETYTLNWGPQIYTNLTGEYSVKIIWETISSKYFDSSKKEWRNDIPIWTGKIETQEIKIILD